MPQVKKLRGNGAAEAIMIHVKIHQLAQIGKSAAWKFSLYLIGRHVKQHQASNAEERCRDDRSHHYDHPESKQKLQMTLSQWQQSELEFHDSKSTNRVSDEEPLVASTREALNWRRACFLSSEQQREGVKKMRNVPK
jgi:hypothetical protein